MGFWYDSICKPMFLQSLTWSNEILISVIKSFLARRRPYHEIDTEIQVVLAVCHGQLPEKPEIFNEWPAHYLATWNLCEACWLREPRIRPKMGLVIARLEEIISSLESPDIGNT